MEQKTINKIKNLFKSSNFVTSYDIKRKGVTKEELKEFTDYFKLVPSYSHTYGIFLLKKDGEVLDVSEIKSL